MTTKTSEHAAPIEDAETTDAAEAPKAAPIENPHHEADRNWLAGQHPDNIRRIAIRFRIANGPGATVEEMRENIFARIDGHRRRGELLDVRCPVCRAPVVIDKYQPRTTPEEVEAGRARRNLRCLGAHQHLSPRFVPIDLT